MNYDELEGWSAKVAAWGSEYLQGLRHQPIRPQVAPGAVAAQVPPSPPEHAENMEVIFADFQRLIPSAMTHWQHPRFFAYFPSNAAPASIMAEQVANYMSAQCMLWQTSPAATELETVMIDWLRQALGLPDGWRGVLQDTATSATLSAVLTMREKALAWRGLREGLSGMPRMRIYASAQTHSSIDKAVRLAGIGQDNLVKVPTDANYAMRADALQRAIDEDRAAGFLPVGVIGCIGGTSIGASDRLDGILAIAQQESLYSHVDAAWAGSAMICPEFREIWCGIERADSVVFNPHKWLGANFDCSVQFLKQPADQVRTLAIRPQYLETLETDQITNYSEWTIPLGRRFRALKLWFLLRAYGLEGLRTRIRNHVAWTNEAAQAIAKAVPLEIVTAPRLGLFTFRYAPAGADPDLATRALLEAINSDGRTYLTQTTHEGRFVIRMSVGHFETTRADVLDAVAIICELADKLRLD
ncbi:MAG: aspartate aminotransferase family protein [Planctomycetaceae bacterium]|nr:aspartate aminotransferase family protein [Planctomycetaceae bacterium]